MAEASGHDEEVEDLVGAEVGVAFVELRHFDGVEDATQGVDDAAHKEPQEAAKAKGVVDWAKDQDHDPAHGDIDHRGEPLGTINPKELKADAKKGHDPDSCQKWKADGGIQHQKAYWGVGSCNQDENHGVIQFSEYLDDGWAEHNCMVGGAGAVQEHEAHCVYHHGSDVIVAKA